MLPKMNIYTVIYVKYTVLYLSMKDDCTKFNHLTIIKFQIYFFKCIKGDRINLIFSS